MTTRSEDLEETGRAAIVRKIAETASDAYAAATFKEALHELAKYARLMIGAHQSALSYVPDGDFHAAIHTHSFSKKYEQYNTYDVMPTGEGIWGLVVEQKAPMRLTQEELVSHPRWRNFGDMKDERGLEHPVMRGWLVVPILRQNGGFVGVLQLSDKFDGDFTEEDEVLLLRLGKVISPTFDLHYVNDELKQRTEALTLASQAAQAANEALQQKQTELERGRLELQALTGRLLTAQEDERRRISRDLHDDLNQRLALLTVEIESLQARLPTSRRSTVAQLGALRDSVVEISDYVHGLAYELHASILEDIGLPAALQAYVDDFTKREGIQVEFTQARLTAPVSRDIASCLYRVAQEALRNVAKHASTTSASVSLEHVDAGIRLVVADSGGGFEVSESDRRSSSLGLIGMRERVLLAHGRFSVTSRPSLGTQIDVWVPLREGEA